MMTKGNVRRKRHTLYWLKYKNTDIVNTFATAGFLKSVQSYDCVQRDRRLVGVHWLNPFHEPQGISTNTYCRVDEKPINPKVDLRDNDKKTYKDDDGKDGEDMSEPAHLSLGGVGRHFITWVTKKSFNLVFITFYTSE